MSDLQQHQEVCRYFSALLGYPGQNVADDAAACSARLQEISPAATESLDEFTRFLQESSLTRIEEAFTGTFDLQSLCHPYVGYQLCGESQQRTIFMLKLKELYQQHGFASGNELPDHLTEVLRFVGSINDENCRQEIIRDGLQPALEKMQQGIEEEGHPYMALLNALRKFLNDTVTTEECLS